MSPLDSESRMAAQLAPFTIVELMPYFLNRPFSCAITMGEQSVSAIMPKRMSVTSGLEALLTLALVAPVALASLGAASLLLHAGSARAAGSSAPALSTSRRPNVVMSQPPSEYQNATGRSSCTTLCSLFEYGLSSGIANATPG